MKRMFLVALVTLFTMGTTVSCTDPADEDQITDEFAGGKDEEPDRESTTEIDEIETIAGGKDEEPDRES